MQSETTTTTATVSKTSTAGEIVNKGAGDLKVFLLTLIVLQNTASVLVGHYTLAEGKLIQSLKTHVVARPYDAVKISIPALLYLIQNTVLYVALSNLSAPLFQVTYQGKLVTTAIVSVLMLSRKYSPQQWFCLIQLSVGVAVVVLGENEEDTAATARTHRNMSLGLACVATASMSSALAGVYFEKVLKSNDFVAAKEAPPSLWLRNIQLSFFSILIAGFQLVTKPTPAYAVGRPYFFGFTPWVWLLVALQAAGGLLVAAVMKYADNVLKGLATGVSVVFASYLSTVLFGTSLTGEFIAGSALILTGVYFFNNPIKILPSVSEKDTELNELLPK